MPIDVAGSDKYLLLDVIPAAPHTNPVFLGLSSLPPVKVSVIPRGARGTEETVRQMARLASEGGRDPRIRGVAAQIVGRDLPGRAYNLEASRLLRWVQKNIRYTLDPRGMEWVQTPVETLRVGTGDCDDATTLFCALALVMGHACGFRAIKIDANRPREYSHIYAIIRTARDGPWRAADASDRKFALGQVPERRAHLFGAGMWQVNAEDGRAIPLRTV